MKLQALPWIILFLPLVAAGIITFFTRANKAVSGGVSIAAVVLGFVGSVVLVLANGWQVNQELAATWLAIGDLQVEFGTDLIGESGERQHGVRDPFNGRGWF